MLRKIIPHGQLKKLIPTPVTVDASTVAEAIRGLCTVTSGILNPTPSRGRKEISIAGYDTRDSLYSPLEDSVTEIHIFPALVGGKSGGFLQIVVGAVLVVVGVVVGALTSWTGAGLWVAYGLISMGASMMLGGAISLLSPSPKVDTGSYTSDPESSKYLGSPQNTTKLGTRIPILYGRTRVYGQILSFSLQATDVPV